MAADPKVSPPRDPAARVLEQLARCPDELISRWAARLLAASSADRESNRHE
jgi:hypothetical protein